jgi:hypothetical protein
MATAAHVIATTTTMTTTWIGNDVFDASHHPSAGDLSPCGRPSPRPWDSKTGLDGRVGSWSSVHEVAVGPRVGPPTGCIRHSAPISGAKAGDGKDASRSLLTGPRAGLGGVECNKAVGNNTHALLSTSEVLQDHVRLPPTQKTCMINLPNRLGCLQTTVLPPQEQPHPPFSTPSFADGANSSYGRFPRPTTSLSSEVKIRR